MLKFLKKMFKSHSERIIADLRSQVQLIQDATNELTKMSDSQLRDKTQEFKNMVANNAPLETIQYSAFAVVREAARRTIGIQHYDEQLIGGLLLHQGKVVEMNTGEGKTLVATLPSYLNAISGNGVHVVTVNDYLAQRDSNWMGKIHRFLGLTVGCITSNTDNYKRKLAYNNDITYITNNELGFDFLRDNMQFSSKDKVQRAHDYAIIDEIDSILIDEARTPLIISGPINDNTSLYPTINNLITKLSEDDFEKDEKMRAVTLTEKGIIKIENMLSEVGLITSDNKNLYDFENMHLIHYINQSLKAHTLFRRNVDYLVKDAKVVIIDEFTGRTMDSRRYSEGLHQALEAKEKVEIQNENQTLASITFQNYFRMYNKLSGMTGTAMTEATELKETYNLEVVSVPTHNPVCRKDYDDEIYSTKADKYQAIVNLITQCQEKGQPVLVGTVSIEKSEELSKILRKNKIAHNVLNAKYHDKEALIIAQAGRFGAVTIATNMAGRGTDIMLGGNAEMLLIDSEKLSPEEYQVQLQSAQAKVEKEKEKVLEAGGLFVIGTERHESRRIDNQLRGRAGRQGDPGETKFFLSLEDDLMRIFASDRMASVLRNMGLKDNEAIHHPLINRSLAIAQRKIETQNYEIRKNLLKYDDVMNDQRTVIYKQRNEAMASNNINNMLFNITEQIIIDMVDSYMPLHSYKEDWNIAELTKKYQYVFNIHFTTESVGHINSPEDMVKHLTDTAFNIYKKLLKENEEQAINESIKFLFIKSLDQAWKEHLYALDHLKQGISLRAYGQKDPLNEYKREAFLLFESMLNNLKYAFVQLAVRLQIDKTHTSLEEIIELDKANNHATSLVSDKPQQLQQDKGKTDWQQSISRNQLCPCNSGRKFKHCHGALP